MKTRDGLLDIEFVASAADAVFGPADWSIINVPDSVTASQTLSRNLFNTPGREHLTLLLCRHSRKRQMQALDAIASFPGKSWSFLNTVHITYEKPSSGSNNGLLPIGESGYIFYKGEAPDTKATSWFSDGQQNATNVWDLGVRPEEPSPLFYQKFSWELGLLMHSMCAPLEHRAFIYAADIGVDEIPSLLLYCQKREVKCRLYVTDEVEYRKIIQFLTKREAKN